MKMNNKSVLKKIASAVVLSTALLSLTGCYPFLYHAPLQQGNVINPEAVSKLKIGMTRDQVLSTMGTPMLETPLSPDTWHYVYMLRVKDKLADQKRLDLYFHQNRLASISAH